MLKIYTLFLAILINLTLLGCTMFGARTVEEPKFRVIEISDEFEVRRYEPQIIAKFESSKAMDDASNSSFRQIADYIFGNNETKTKVAMTAPVVEQPASEKIAMTAPVVQSDSDNGSTMYFVMPEKYSLSTLPKPKNPNIKIEQVPPETVAVYKYSGLFSMEKFDRYANKLREWLDLSGYEAISAARSARYNPPWTIPFLRRNEVQITVKPKPN